jgi:hypothetical protein
VLNTLREQGLVPTLRKVKERLKAPTSLGYSCAGTVVAVGPEVDEFHVSERVACIGEGVATHAEYNAVPRNLVVRVPAGVSLDAASAISSISPSFSRAACRSRFSAFATPDPARQEESWAVAVRFANGGLGVVHYVCGSQQGWERETIDILGGGRSAQITGFRRLVLRGGRGGGMRQLQPDAGQRAMLQAMVAQFSGAPGAADYSESFLVSAQAVIAAQRAIAERRVVKIEARFPFAIS